MPVPHEPHGSPTTSHSCISVLVLVDVVDVVDVGGRGVLVDVLLVDVLLVVVVLVVLVVTVVVGVSIGGTHRVWSSSALHADSVER